MNRRSITIGLAQEKVTSIRSLAKEGLIELAEAENLELIVDALHTIANAPTMADKRELKRLAVTALQGAQFLDKLKEETK